MKRKKIFIACSMLFLFHIVNAQVTTTSKDSTILYVPGEGTYFNLGLGNAKAKSIKLNVATVLQPGFQTNKLDSSGVTNKTNRLSLNLARVHLTANTFKNKVSVGVVTDFTGSSPLLEGWLAFKIFNDKLKITVGEKQTNTNNRLALEDERYLQTLAQTTAGRSSDGVAYGGLMQTFVKTTREGGLFLETKFRIKNIKFYPSFSLTNGEGQGLYDTINTTKYKYGGRLDIMLLGDFIKNNAFIADDIYREPKPKLALGFAASCNVKTNNSVGNGASDVSGIYNHSGAGDYADYRKVFADFIFKYRGFSLVGEYVNSTVSGTNLFTNASATIKLTPEVASSRYYLGNGYNIQSSYVFKNGLSVSGRYSTIIPEYNIASSLTQKQNWYTFNINKYLKNNAIKIGINTTYIDYNTASVSYNKWISNIAFQLIF